jgi:DNA replication and repair protein RecF
MSIDTFEAWHFRNFTHLCLTPAPRLNVIYGDNGSGKTSLIEAIYIMARLRSFRTSHFRNLISNGEADFLCRAKLHDASGHLHHLGIQRSKDSLLIKLDGDSLRRSSELAHLMPLQLINNDVHLLIEGGPRERRQFLDWGVFHVEPHYGVILKQLRHILSQRNAALKQHWTPQQIRHWDLPLVEASNQVHQMRQDYLDRLQPFLEQLLADSFNLPSIDIQYAQGWDKELSYEHALQQSLATDLQRGKTHYGPHRADLRLRSAGKPLKEVVSRGQQKILATLMMLAQIEFYKQHSGRGLVLLIDDLPAELDRHFARFFLDKVMDSESQVFVTTTDYHSLQLPDTMAEGKMFHVEHGQIREV